MKLFCHNLESAVHKCETDCQKCKAHFHKCETAFHINVKCECGNRSTLVGNIECGPRQAFMANVITPAARTTLSNYMCKKMQEISDGTAPTRVDKLLRQRGDAPNFFCCEKRTVLSSFWWGWRCCCSCLDDNEVTAFCSSLQLRHCKTKNLQ